MTAGQAGRESAQGKLALETAAPLSSPAFRSPSGDPWFLNDLWDWVRASVNDPLPVSTRERCIQTSANFRNPQGPGTFVLDTAPSRVLDWFRGSPPVPAAPPGPTSLLEIK